MKRTVIAIAGGSASGKTTLSKLLAQKLQNKSTLFPLDNFYKSNDGIDFEKRKEMNYDSPEAFDFELMTSHLKSLVDGTAVDCPVYDYKTHNRSNKTVRLESNEFIIVEGILALENEEMRKLSDFKVFVETGADERILRRIERDCLQRGRDVNDVIAQYRSSVKPMHEKYIEPSKEFADIVINGENDFEKSIALILEMLK